MSHTRQELQGRYEGEFVAKFLTDGRLVQLVEPFSYIDSFTMRWDVPKGWKVDGASIPRPLWTLVGSPLTGLYRDASVIHDYFCDIKSRPWGAVHRVFYEAMLTSNVPQLRARTMYAAVCWGGPRWSVETVNTYEEVFEDYLRSSSSRSGRVHYPMLGPEFDDVSSYTRTVTIVSRFPFDEDDLKELDRKLVAAEVPDENIAEFVDAEIQERGLSLINEA